MYTFIISADPICPQPRRARPPCPKLSPICPQTSMVIIITIVYYCNTVIIILLLLILISYY